MKNTRRFFVESEEISFYHFEDEVCYLTLEIKQAWAIDIQELLVEYSKKYHVDFNIYMLVREVWNLNNISLLLTED